ncbi:MAG: alpha/beta hydrolase [Deltaproteobacteria bacterium]|nr:alpha/beta hydrolase [Deltaproteobacteria bacterium]
MKLPDYNLFSFLERLASSLNIYPEWLQKRSIPAFNFRQYGSKGPRVILLHGLFGHLSNWDKVLPRLQMQCELYSLEFPILKGDKSEVSVKSLSLYVTCFLYSQNLFNSYLCGNSLGGHVAIRVSLLVPEVVKGLILAGPSGLYENSIDTLPLKPDKDYIAKHMKRVFYDSRHVTNEYVDEIHRIISNKDNVKKLLIAAKSAKRDYLLNELPSICVPTLLLWGRNDEITSLEVGQVFATKIPKSILKVKDNCGHAPMMEEPEWFADEVLKFLEGNE